MPLLSSCAQARPPASELDAYLQVRNIKCTATLALWASTWSSSRTVVTPWSSGYIDTTGHTHKPKNTDAAVNEAILVHMWLEVPGRPASGLPSQGALGR